jgi:hypothetical protein
MSYFADQQCGNQFEPGENSPSYWYRESFELPRKSVKADQPKLKRVSYVFCSCGAEFDIPQSDLAAENYGQPKLHVAWESEHTALGHRTSHTYRYDPA